MAAGLALGLLVAGVFAPVAGYDFVLWDDNINVTGNALLTGPWSWELAGKFFDPQTALRFKPLHWLVFRLVADGAGMNPVAWHVLGLVFHACTAVVVWWVFRCLLRRSPCSGEGWPAEVLAWLGAALWALHPLRVEPVAWVTASTYPMTGLLLAGSFGAYLKAYEPEADKGWLAFSWVLAVAAYATYPVSVTYVGWLVVADIFWLRVLPAKPWRWTERATRRWWGKHLLFGGPAVAVVVATLWIRFGNPGSWTRAPSMGSLGWDERLMAAWALLTVFPAKVVWPLHLTPNQSSLTQTVWMTGWVLTFAVISAVVAAGLLWLGKRRPGWLGVGLGFAVLAVPCLGLTERPTWPVDRYSYVLDMVVIGAVVMMISALLSTHWKTYWPVLLVLVAGVLVSTVATRRLLPVWQNSLTLFARMESHPEFGSSVTQQAHVYTLWYIELTRAGRLKEAGEKLERANDIYLSAMRLAVSVRDYERAVWLADFMEVNLGLSPSVRRERGGWLLKLGRRVEALDDLRRVLKDSPGDERAAGMLAEAGG